MHELAHLCGNEINVALSFGYLGIQAIWVISTSHNYQATFIHERDAACHDSEKFPTDRIGFTEFPE